MTTPDKLMKKPHLKGKLFMLWLKEHKGGIYRISEIKKEFSLSTSFIHYYLKAYAKKIKGSGYWNIK